MGHNISQYPKTWFILGFTTSRIPMNCHSGVKSQILNELRIQMAGEVSYWVWSGRHGVHWVHQPPECPEFPGAPEAIPNAVSRWECGTFPLVSTSRVQLRLRKKPPTCFSWLLAKLVWYVYDFIVMHQSTIAEPEIATQVYIILLIVYPSKYHHKISPLMVGTESPFTDDLPPVTHPL